ncbi:MAG: hypothetical protein RLZZ558_686 [Planctomycetota bacterium]
MRDLIHIEDAQGVRTISLNRPEARNALSLALIQELEAAVQAVASNADVRVLVLRGQGKSFCAGMDLRGVIDDPVQMGSMLHGLARTSLALRHLRVPVIACVRGAAIGGGCGLMATADLAVTHPEARLGYPEVDLGICPAVVAPILMRRIGAGRARAMLLTGGVVDGTEAHRIGLATHLAAEAELEAATHALAARLVAGGAQAIATTKAWLAELETELDATTMQRAADLSARIIQGSEAQERLRARFAQPPRAGT